MAVGGGAAQALADEATTAGLPSSQIAVVADKGAAVDEVLRRVRPGDLVLVKGSRGIGLDLVVDRLKAEFA